MFSPKMPSLFVLIGDQASKEAERLVSVLVDHAVSTHYALMQVICLWETEPEKSLNHPLIRVSHYTTGSVGRDLSAIVRDKRDDIMGNIGGAIAANMQLQKQYIAFVAKGLSISAQYCVDLLNSAQQYIKASGCQFLSQFCFLAEDDPLSFSSQRQWILNPDHPDEINPGFTNFDHFLLLTPKNERCIHNYQTQLQMEGAFAIGLLYMASGKTHPHKLSTIGYGKINGSSRDLQRIRQDIVVETLCKWAASSVSASAGWEILSTDSVNLLDITSEEALINALKTDLQKCVPSLSDLAAVGIDQKNLSCPDLILSFDSLNQESTYMQNESDQWAEQWIDEVCRKLISHPYADDLIRLLDYDTDEGIIGRTIHNASADAYRQLQSTGNTEQWLRKQWNNIQIPQHTIFQSLASYNLITLRAYYIPYQRLCIMRSLCTRLAAMEQARKRLQQHITEQIQKRDTCLEKYRLPDNEKEVLHSLCKGYADKVKRAAGQIAIHDLPIYYNAIQTLYHHEKFEDSWASLFDALMKKTKGYLNEDDGFGAAFATGQQPLALQDKIKEHPFYDYALLPQLLNGWPKEDMRTFYLIPDTIYQRLPNGREQEGFVSIPEDVIERVTFMPLGNINRILELNIFSDISFPSSNCPPRSIVKNESDTTLETASACAPKATPWNVKLMDTGNQWTLFWDWIGNAEDTAIITWGNNNTRVTNTVWQTNGRAVSLAPATIPFGCFKVNIKCGDESTCTEVDGRRLSVNLIKNPTLKTSLQLPDGTRLSRIAFHLEGRNAAITPEHPLLLCKAGKTHAYYYDLLTLYTMDDINTRCIAYCDDMETLSLEGNDILKGFVDTYII